MQMRTKTVMPYLIIALLFVAPMLRANTEAECSEIGLAKQWERRGYDRMHFGMEMEPGSTAISMTGWDGNVWFMEATEEKKSIAMQKIIRIEGMDLIQLAWHPSGKILAVGSRDGKIGIVNTQNYGKLLTSVRPVEGNVLQLKWDSEGKWLAARIGKHWYIFEFKANHQQLNLKNSMENVLYFDWHPYLPIMAIIKENALEIVSIPSLKIRKQLQPIKMNILSWHPNEKFILLGGDKGEISLLDADSLMILKEVISQPFPIKDIAWDKQGETFAAVGDSNLLQIWDFKRMKLIDRYVSNGLYESVRWHPALKRFIASDHPERILIIPSFNKPDPISYQILSQYHAMTIAYKSDALISPQNTRFIFEKDQPNIIDIFNIQTGIRTAWLESHIPYIKTLLLDNQEHYLAVTGNQGIEIWDYIARRLIAHIYDADYQSRFSLPYWSADGRWIAYTNPKWQAMLCDKNLIQCQTIEYKQNNIRFTLQPIGWSQNNELLLIANPPGNGFKLIAFKDGLFNELSAISYGTASPLGLTPDRAYALFKVIQNENKELWTINLNSHVIHKPAKSEISGNALVDREPNFFNHIYPPELYPLEIFQDHLMIQLYSTSDYYYRYSSDPSGHQFSIDYEPYYWSKMMIWKNSLITINNKTGTIRKWDMFKKPCSDYDAFEGIKNASVSPWGTISLYWDAPLTLNQHGGSFRICYSTIQGDCKKSFWTKEYIDAMSHKSGTQLLNLKPGVIYYFMARWQFDNDNIDKNQREISLYVPVASPNSKYSGAKIEEMLSHKLLIRWDNYSSYCMENGPFHYFQPAKNFLLIYCDKSPKLSLWKYNSSTKPVFYKALPDSWKDPDSFVFISPDAQKVAVMKKAYATPRLKMHHISIIKLYDFQIIKEWDLPDADTNNATWSPDSHYIATSGCMQPIRIWNADSGNELMRSDALSSCTAGIAWHPTKISLVYASDDELYILSGDSTDEKHHIVYTNRLIINDWSKKIRYSVSEMSGSKHIGLWWHPDGDSIFLADGMSLAKIYRASDLKVINYFFTAQNVDYVTWSPSRKLLIVFFGSENWIVSLSMDSPIFPHVRGFPLEWVDETHLITMDGLWNLEPL